MCLAIPLKVKEVKDDVAISSQGKEIDISLIKDKVKVGSYLLVHDDLAVNSLPKEEAEKIKEIVGSCHHQHGSDHDHSHDQGHSHSHSH
jgi:hydrogenase assembly chaperone HypC/HupF